MSESSDELDKQVLLLANDKSGSSGRTRKFYINKDDLPKGEEYIGKFKVITTSAYPKKTFASGKPTLSNVRERAKELVELLPRNSAFGASRLCLFMSDIEQECKNFMKYTQTEFFAALTLQEPNRRSSFGFIIPDQDFSDNSDINWNASISEIDKQLFAKYNITTDEQKFLGVA